MVDTLPTQDEAFGSIPTVDEAFGENPVMASIHASQNQGSDIASTKGVFSGEFADWAFSRGPVGRTLRAFGQGAAEAWGAAHDDLQEESRQALQKIGLTKAYQDNKSSIIKSSNESWMRSAASNLYSSPLYALGVSPKILAEGASEAVSGLLGGISGAGERIATELHNTGEATEGSIPGLVGKTLGYPFKLGAELTSGALQGAIIPEAGLHRSIDEARSNAVIGESEGKYFGTVDPSATDKAARAEATGNLISDTSIPEDIHQAARRYAPDEFSKYDSLVDQKEALQEKFETAYSEHLESPEMKKAEETVDSLLDSVNGDESELSEQRQEELSKARDTLQSDSEDSSRIRGYVKDIDKEITDLSPAIQDAYRLADVGNTRLSPGISGEELSPEVPPTKSVKELSEGEIAKDVTKKLIAAGRPEDEARIAGILYQQRYENRVYKSPHLGAAEDLYKAEGPDIIRGKSGDKSSKGLNQSVGKIQPTFYSSLIKAISELKQNKASPKEWSNIIDNLKNKGVKQEEIDWSGIKEFLHRNTPEGFDPPVDKELHPDLYDALNKPIHKGELLDHLRQNQVQLQEKKYSDDWMDVKSPPTRYHEYVLLGGENYKELLLTLPEKPGERGPTGWGDSHGGTFDSANYMSSHWAEPNILAHVRFDDRVGPNGEKILHLAEVQSDWHQQGRRRGYQSQEELKRLSQIRDKALKRLFEAQDTTAKEHGWDDMDSFQKDLTAAANKSYDLEDSKILYELSDKSKEAPEYKELVEKYNKALHNYKTLQATNREIARSDAVLKARHEYVDANTFLKDVQSGVPDAPFKTSWPELALKRMIRYAAEHGYDKLSWDTGVTNADRYNLAKTVKQVLVEENPDGGLLVKAYDHKDNKVINQTTSPEKLVDLIGKDAADKAIEQINSSKKAGSSIGRADLRGLDLQVGGEGMKGFYDKILSDVAKKIGKKFNAKVEDVNLPNRFTGASGETILRRLGVPEAEISETWGNMSQEKRNELLNIVKKEVEKTSTPVHSLDITPEMKKSVLETGQPLFQERRGSLTKGMERNIIRLFEKADASTFLHETGHQWLEELVKDASHEKASEELKADLAAVRSWVGNKGEEFTRAQHEKFARGFERYLREGNAPNQSLAIVFQRFKEWLTSIYKTLRELPNAKLDDSIRDVFDRLIVPERDRPVVAPEEFGQSARSREKQIQAHIRSIEEHARSRAIEKFMTSVRERAAERSREPKIVKLSDKRFIGAAELEGGKTPRPGEISERENQGEVEVVPNNIPEEGVRNKPDHDPDPDERLETKSTPLVDPAGNIRIENLTSDNDLQTAIRQAYEQNKEELDKSRGRVSTQSKIDLAEAGGIKTDSINMVALVRAADSGGIPLSAYVDILRQAFIQSAKNLKGIMEGDDEVAYAEASTRHLALSRHLMGITAEWGRTGKSFRSLAEEARGAQELSEFLQISLGKTLQQLRTEMRLGRYLDSSRKVSGFIQDMSKPGYGEWVLEAFKNWLISGPITHTIYAVGNELFTLNRLIEGLTRVGISTLRGPGEGSSEIGEIRERAYGIASGHLDGLRAFWESFKAGQTALLPGEEIATTAFTQHKQIPGVIGTIVRLPSERLVAPLHSLARTIAFMEERNGLIYRQAVSEGLEGDALKQRIAELKNNVPVGITVEARAAASEAALMGRPGEFTRKVVAMFNQSVTLPNWAGGTWRPGGFIAPFITVSSNINRLSLLERTPIGLLSKQIRDDLSGKNGRLNQETAMSKMIVGTALGTGVGTLYAMGLVNPGAPEDYRHAIVEQAVNGMPHSIRIGEMSYDLNRLGILGADISVAADIAAFTKKGVFEAFEKNDPHLTEDAAAEFVLSIKDHLIREGFLSGVSDVFKAVNDSGRYGESWAKNFLSTAILPYSIGMTQITQRIDPYQRDTHGTSFLDTLTKAVKARIPFESETLEPKIDLFGQPIPNREYWGVYATKISNDPVWKALKDVGYFPAPVKRTIMGIPLTPEQYHDYAVKSGIISKMLLDGIISMNGFESLPVPAKHDLVKEAITSGRQAAAATVLAESARGPDSIIAKAIKVKQDALRGTSVSEIQ